MIFINIDVPSILGDSIEVVEENVRLLNRVSKFPSWAS